MQCFEWQSLSSSTFRLLRGGSASGIVTKWSQGRRLVGVQLYSDCFFLPSCLCHCETILSFSFFLKIHHHVSISITIVSKLLEYVNIYLYCLCPIFYQFLKYIKCIFFLFLKFVSGQVIKDIFMPTNLLIPTSLQIKTTVEQLSYYWKKDNKTFRPSDLRERNLTDNFFIKRQIFT